MGCCTPAELCAVEDSPLMIRARIENSDGDLLTQANTSGISYTVRDTDDGSEVTNGTLTVPSVIYDALQLDDEWEEDGRGFNFKWLVPPSHFPAGDKRYSIELTITPTSGYAFKEPIYVTTEPLFGS